MTIIQIPDALATDPTTINCYAFNEASLPAGGFVLVECLVSGRHYLGQVICPQLNFNRDGLGPTDVTTVNQLEHLQAQRLGRDVVVKEVHYYRIHLLKDVTGGAPTSVRRRPQIGSLGRAATDEEVIRFLSLPAGRPESLLGFVTDSTVPVCVDARVLSLHILVAGATGSGKSNTNANIVVAGLNEGRCAILLDHKPDYQNVDEPNDETTLPFRQGISGACFWRLGDDGHGARADECPISVPASELDPRVLAHTICFQPSERNAAEVLDTLLCRYAEMCEGKPWSLDQFFDALPANVKELEAKFGIEVNSQTYAAMRHRLRRRSRRPVWIDAAVRSANRDFFGSGGARPFDLRAVARAGRLIVLRIPSSQGDGRSYGLFLSYILREAYRMREEAPGDSPRLLFVIDEAQDIFNAGKSFQEAAGEMLSAHIRKGRSRGIGFVISVQSADAVPEDIRNNLNSQLIHRHNNSRQAREAMTRATPEQLAQTDTFGPGECLAHLSGASAVVHARMRQSPFKLTKE